MPNSVCLRTGKSNQEVRCLLPLLHSVRILYSCRKPVAASLGTCLDHARLQPLCSNWGDPAATRFPVVAKKALPIRRSSIELSSSSNK